MPRVGELVLSSGRTVLLRELRQFHTYEGLLEGLPTAEMNQRYLDRLAAKHSGKVYPGGPAHMIVPQQQPIEFDKEREYPFGTPATLPAVTCIGRFESNDPARDKDSDYSGLLVIWLQQEFAFPIEPGVVGQIQALDWERLAADLVR